MFEKGTIDVVFNFRWLQEECCATGKICMHVLLIWSMLLTDYNKSIGIDNEEERNSLCFGQISDDYAWGKTGVRVFSELSEEFEVKIGLAPRICVFTLCICSCLTCCY